MVYVIVRKFATSKVSGDKQHSDIVKDAQLQHDLCIYIYLNTIILITGHDCV